MTIYVSINRAIISSNHKNGRNDAPYEIRQSKDDQNPRTVHSESFTGTIRLVYDRKNPLICQAVCWIEIDEGPAPGTVINLSVGERADIADGL